MPQLDIQSLIQEIGLQKSLMIAVSTGGPRIQDVNHEYMQRRLHIKELLASMGFDDPNPYSDLWAWYGRWSNGELPRYQHRRVFIRELYQPLFDKLLMKERDAAPITPPEPTGWEAVDRQMDKILDGLETAQHEEDFQMVGLLCREAMISLAQEIFDPLRHKTLDGTCPSKTDAYRMIEAYIATELEGNTFETMRSFAKASLKLANELQHKRTADYRDAVLSAEASRAIVAIIAVLSGKREKNG